MKRSLAALIFGLCMLVVAGAQSTTLAVVSEWPPFQYSEGNQIKGADVDILRAAFKQMNQPLSISVYPWSRCVHMVQNKQADMIFTLSKNAEREEYLIFPKQPINVSQNVLFVRKNSSIKFDSYNDLRGLSIGVSAGYSYGNEFDSSTVFRKSEAADEATNFRMLAASRIDAFVCDKLVGVYMLKQMNMGDSIVYLPKVISEFQMFVGFAKKPGAEALANRFDTAMLAIKASGEYKQILDRYTK